jgi:predicted nucleotidyltransferase
MHPADEIVERARAWACTDERVLAALVHGSVARADATPLSDVDLVVVTRPGLREQLWAERDDLTRRLLGSDAAVAHEVPHQRPFRWQARTASLQMLDLTLDDGELAMWPGLAGEVEFLVDRGGVRAHRDAWLAGNDRADYDVVGSDDQVWSILAWLAGGLLHGRVWLVRWGITDLLGQRVVPVSGRDAIAVGTMADDPLTSRLDAALPRSSARSELAHALRQTATFYRELVTEWSARTGSTTPASPLMPAVMDTLDRLVAGRGERLSD